MPLGWRSLFVHLSRQHVLLMARLENNSNCIQTLCNVNNIDNKYFQEKTFRYYLKQPHESNRHNALYEYNI